MGPKRLFQAVGRENLHNPLRIGSGFAWHDRLDLARKMILNGHWQDAALQIGIVRDEAAEPYGQQAHYDAPVMVAAQWAINGIADRDTEALDELEDVLIDDGVDDPVASYDERLPYGMFSSLRGFGA